MDENEEFKETVRELVLPGDLLDEGNYKVGIGTYREGKRIYSALLGFKSIRSNYVNVVPLSGKYVPRPGDSIIGKVIGIGPTNWLIDINSPYPAPLHINEVPWRVDFGDTARFLNVGDTVLVKAQTVDEIKRVQVTMKGVGLRKLIGGQIVEISPFKVPRVIGKGGSMISLIKKYTNCRIFVGQNGRIWIDGELDDITNAILAIKRIEKDAHTTGLTNVIEDYLRELTGKRFNEMTGES